MTKDYARYSIYRTRRPRYNRLWIILGLILSLFVLGVALLYVKVHSKQETAQPASDKLQKKIVETPAPKPAEPKFDFYNILPQDNLTLSSQANNDLTLAAANEVSSAAPHFKKPLDDLLSATPEQVAIAEAKKQLEREMNQLSNETYLLVLGDFPDASQAEQYQAKALLRGFSVRSTANTLNGKVSYQLFLGPYSDQKLALQQQKRLNAAGMPAVLVKSK